MRKFFMAVTIGLILTGCAEEKVQEKEVKEELNQFVYTPDMKIEFHDYKITQKDKNGFYYAESLADDTGVYFNYEYTNEDFEVGDLVVATFDTTKEEDNLTEVYSK